MDKFFDKESFVVNKGSVPSIESGSLVHRPKTAEVGSLYIEPRLRCMYRFNGVRWELLFTLHTLQSINSPSQASNKMFFTIAEGQRKIYTDADALTLYGIHHIPSPNEVSYINLFINSTLQPVVNYRIEEGKLILLTEDPPIDGANIIIQFITLY